MIEAPKRFKEFAECFLYDLYDDYTSVEEFIAMESRWGTPASEAQNIILRDFLTQLIEGPYTDAELEALWDSVQLDFPLTGEEVRRYLPLMRDNVLLPPPLRRPKG